jgi:mycothiol system anti-sigma-R factor
MKGCDDYSATIQIYLDWELSGQELEDFPPHLEQCEACLTELEAEERLSALLHRLRPLYSAPAALRGRVSSPAWYATRIWRTAATLALIDSRILRQISMTFHSSEKS